MCKCCVYTSRAHSMVATLCTCEVEQTIEAKARLVNGRDVRSGKLRSWAPCVQPRVEPHSWKEATYCARGKLATQRTCTLHVAVMRGGTVYNVRACATV